jgi:hypothetical protein
VLRDHGGLASRRRISRVDNSTEESGNGALDSESRSDTRRVELEG